jgi:cell division protein FtsL
MNGRRLSGFYSFPFPEKFFEGWILTKVAQGRFWKIRPRALFWILGGAILFFAFLLLWQRHQMIRIGYEIEQLREERVELLRMQKELLIEAESLTALDRIERIATEQLNMKQALPQQRVYTKRPAPAG